MTLIVVGLLTLGIFIGSNALLRAVSRPNATAARLSGIAAGGGMGRAPAEQGDSSTFGDRLLGPLTGWLASNVSQMLPARLAQHAEARLIQAGNPISTSAFLAAQVLLPAAFILLGAAGVARAGLITPLSVLLVLGGLGGLGVIGPLVWLDGRIARRQGRIQRELPDALDLLVVSVEAGLGLEGAMARVAESGAGPVATEFRRVLFDMNIGAGKKKAMLGMTLRTGVPAVGSLVSAILQADQTGMAVGQVLRAQAEHLRTQRRQMAEEKAMKAPLKMLFPIVMFIFPSLFVVVLAPAMMTFLNTLNAD